ncbi:MAG: hypothetical protein J0L72_04245 [Armatimonadetes bacterium]|nr:hypothetical protein [Armatimonadota bacterium]
MRQLNKSLRTTSDTGNRISLTPKEFAELACRHIGEVYRLIASKSVLTVKVGAIHLIPISEIDRIFSSPASGSDNQVEVGL